MKQTIFKTQSASFLANDHGDVYEFLSIPYAKAGRFEYSELIGSYEGTVDATGMGNACPQYREHYPNLENPERLFYYREFREGIEFRYDEDCLNLNIYVPKNASGSPVVLFFHGGGFNSGSNAEEPFRGFGLAEKGIIYLIPYINPWNWMNRQAVEYTDELIDALFAHYYLPESTPVVSTGGSMGGLCSLVYTKYAKRTPVACVANCPVCDLLFHYTERPDLPRTLYSAYGTYAADTIEEAMATASPLHLADCMPDVKYTIFHCDADQAVNIHSHSEKFVEDMKKSHDIEYIVVPGRGHCDLGDEFLPLYEKAAEDAILSRV